MAKMPRKYWSLLVCHGTAAAAAFMVLPVLSIHLSRSFQPMEVSFILTAQVLVTRLLPLFIGSIADIVSRRFLLLSGLFLQGAGLLFLGWVDRFPLLLAASFIIGFGNVLYDLSAFLFFAGVPDEHRELMFVRSNMLQNTGSILGPAVGSSLYFLNPSSPFITAGAGLCLLMIMLRTSPVLTEPHTKGPVASPEAKGTEGLNPILVFSCIMAFWWLIFSQVMISFPLEASRRAGQDEWGGYILSLSGLIVVVASAGLARFVVEKRLAKIIAAGSLAASVAFFAVPFQNSIQWFVLCVTLYSVIESILLPASEIEIANLIGHEHQGRKRGIYRGITGLGMVAGTFLAPQLIAKHNGLAWIVCGISAVLAAIAYIIWKTVHLESLAPEERT
jgi:MFS family permease